RLGPNLHNIIGRKAGSLQNYGYSSAMKGADFVWDKEKLDHFMAKPDEVVPGHNMKPYGGLTSAEDPAKGIVFLESLSTNCTTTSRSRRVVWQNESCRHPARVHIKISRDGTLNGSYDPAEGTLHMADTSSSRRMKVQTRREAVILMTAIPLLSTEAVAQPDRMDT